MQIQASSLALGAVYSGSASRTVEERMQMEVTAGAAGVGRVSQDEVDVTDAKALVARLIYRTLMGREAPEVGQGGSRAAPAAVAGARGAVRVSYSRRETVQEAERSVFRAEGNVKLSSGKEITFSFRLEMNRELTVVNGVAVTAGNTQDPIALNFDGLGVRLNGAREAFDLDGDGVDEMIATLADGSGWLGEDRNGNGRVDDGGELFGPGTGNGFVELAARDGNGDGWITEDDAVYERLGAWRGEEFVSLRELGVGALSVASVTTPFALKEGTELLGEVRRSGVYLTEEGVAGALQQVDLSV